MSARERRVDDSTNVNSESGSEFRFVSNNIGAQSLLSLGGANPVANEPSDATAIPRLQVKSTQPMAVNRKVGLDDLYDTLDGYITGLDAHVTSYQARLRLLETGHQVLAVPNTIELKLQLLAMLSDIHNRRFKALNNREDLDASIDFGSKVLQLQSTQDHRKVTWLHKMAGLHLKRHGVSSSVEDLKSVVQYEEQAISIVSSDGRIKGGLPGRLGIAYLYLFTQLGNPTHVERAISCMNQAVQLTPEHDPFKGADLGNLGNAYIARFDRFGGLDDVKNAVNCYENAMRSLPEGHPFRLHWLERLARSYQSLFEGNGALENLEKSIQLQKQCVSAPSNRPGRPELLLGLGTSYNMLFIHTGDLDSVVEAEECFHEAVRLASNDEQKSAGLSGLGTAFHSRFRRLGRLHDLERAIELQKQALQTTSIASSRLTLLNNLGISYWSRFQHVGNLEDLDEAISYKTESVALTPDDHPEKPSRLDNLGNSYQLLFERLGDLKDVETAIEHRHRALSLTRASNPDRYLWFNNLGNSYGTLFQRSGSLKDLEKAIEYREQAVRLTPDRHAAQPLMLNNLGGSYLLRFSHLGEQKDITKAISLTERALALTSDNHPSKPNFLSSLSNLYKCKFQSLGRIDDVNCAVSHQETAISLTPTDHPDRPYYLSNLGSLYQLRFRASKNSVDRARAMQCLKLAATMPIGNPLIRFRASQEWARLECIAHGSALEAYTRCMELVPSVAWLGVTVQRRYESLGADIKSLATEAAATAISMSHYELAVEWLEQGRSVVWNQILNLRTPLDQLEKIRPDLAKELKQMSWSLEQLSLPGVVDYSTTDHALSHDVAQKRRRLAERWEGLLDTTRQLPGFGNFLRPPSIQSLQNSVQGAVVVINVDIARCDALILRETGPVLHVYLFGFSYQKARRACEQWADSLKNSGVRRGFTRDKPKHANGVFRQILRMLWCDVAHPIVESLGYNRVRPIDELPRVTWCTTGPLSFLPMHAAGDYDSPGTILANLVISSYTPTLTALRHPVPGCDADTRILIVGQSSTPGLDSLPGTIVELQQIKTKVGALPLTEMSGNDACSAAVLKALENHSWVHFACHASQDMGDPLRSAFYLHDGRLDLATIAKQPLKNAQLAFLSACETATGDTKLPEESLHLAAGILIAGYSSVIATMWSIDDNDASVVAGEVYEHLLEGGVPSSGRAAVALHKAIAQLRSQIGEQEFARWVPFVHFGG